MKRVKVLFVCMGNICRSPTAHGVFQDIVNKAGLADQFCVESAGTIGYHVGEHPDPRATQMAASNNVNISRQVARKVACTDYHQQSFILAMDYDNLKKLKSECPEQYQGKLELLLKYHPDANLEEVPDPYYGGPGGFGNVYEMIELACQNLLQYIRETHSFDQTK